LSTNALRAGPLKALLRNNAARYKGVKFKGRMMKLLSMLLIPLLVGCATEQAIKSNCSIPNSDLNIERANKFINQHKGKPGYISSGNGFIYEKLIEPTGFVYPIDGDTVYVHYTVSGLDGRAIDSSYDRNASAYFEINEVIEGWTLALKDMREGEKRKLYMPPNLAYGCRGQLPKIGPNEMLVFELELLKVK
jgi:FKBP-type peptidyl-prolyl cis-trans isomerase